MRKYVKKIAAILLVCATLAFLASCGNNDTTSSAAVSSEAQTSSEAAVSETASDKPESEAASQAETSSAAEPSSEAVSSQEPVSSEEGIPLQSMIKGTIEDATMNSFVLKTTDGSITFSIGPDTDLSNLPNGLKIGEKVSVQFSGSITGEDASSCVVSRVNPVKS